MRNACVAVLCFVLLTVGGHSVTRSPRAERGIASEGAEDLSVDAEKDDEVAVVIQREEATESEPVYVSTVSPKLGHRYLTRGGRIVVVKTPKGSWAVCCPNETWIMFEEDGKWTTVDSHTGRWLSDIRSSLDLVEELPGGDISELH